MVKYFRGKCVIFLPGLTVDFFLLSAVIGCDSYLCCCSAAGFRWADQK